MTADSSDVVILQISVVAAEQFRVGRADGSPVPIDNQLQHVLVHFHHHRRHLLIRHEEDDGEESHLKLWADTNETATDRLHQAFPTELQIQDVVVFIRCIFVVSCFVAFVVNMVVFLLQVELNPVVETHNLLAVLGLSHKHMFKATGILSSISVPVVEAEPDVVQLSLELSRV